MFLLLLLCFLFSRFWLALCFVHVVIGVALFVEFAFVVFTASLGLVVCSWFVFACCVCLFCFAVVRAYICYTSN